MAARLTFALFITISTVAIASPIRSKRQTDLFGLDQLFGNTGGTQDLFGLAKLFEADNFAKLFQPFLGGTNGGNLDPTGLLRSLNPGPTANLGTLDPTNIFGSINTGSSGNLGTLDPANIFGSINTGSSGNFDPSTLLGGLSSDVIPAASKSNYSPRTSNRGQSRRFWE